MSDIYDRVSLRLNPEIGSVIRLAADCNFGGNVSKLINHSIQQYLFDNGYSEQVDESSTILEWAKIARSKGIDVIGTISRAMKDHEAGNIAS